MAFEYKIVEGLQHDESHDKKPQTHKDSPAKSPVGPLEYNELGVANISDTFTAFSTAKIIPEVVDHISDQATLKITMDGHEVHNGQEVSLDALAAEPQVRITGCSSSDVFTLVMVDPDMPSPSKPKYKDTLYWMVSNIKGGNVEGGDFTVEFMPAEPAQGKHRYVFLLFKNPNGIFTQFNPPNVRVSFQTKQWAKEHGLEPVAGLFVTAEHK